MFSSISINSTSSQMNSNFVKPAKVTLEVENFCNEKNWKKKDFTLPASNIQFSLVCNPQYTYNRFGYKYTTIYLHLHSCDRAQVTVRHQISILNASGAKCEQQERVETFYKNIACGGLYHIRYDHLASGDNEFLVNGKISIYCEIEEVNPTNSNVLIKPQIEVKIPELPENPILQDYQSLLESGKFSDATLIVGGKQFKIHKAILAIRSRVFAAMFENDCEEKRSNRVEIIDIPAEVCQQMLNYIYTGNMPDMEKYAADLFVVGDKYELDHLKIVCEHYLSTWIDVDNAANTLLIADMHHATVLKTKCIHFIVDNASRVMATEGWKVLTKSRVELVIELFQKLAIETKQNQ